jgi:hypothetical protein
MKMIEVIVDGKIFLINPAHITHCEARLDSGDEYILIYLSELTKDESKLLRFRCEHAVEVYGKLKLIS